MIIDYDEGREMKNISYTQKIDYMKIIRRMFEEGAKVLVHADGRVEIIPKGK